MNDDSPPDDDGWGTEGGAAQHVHDWKPLQGWVGRYRCDGCFCIGFRAAVQPIEGKSENIRPYRCKVKQCLKPAIQRRPQRCAAHSLWGRT